MKVYELEKERELLQAIFNEASHKDFQIFMQWFLDSLGTYRAENDTLVDAPGNPALSRNQGRCQVLTEIIGMCANSRNLLEKYKTDPKLQPKT